MANSTHSTSKSVSIEPLPPSIPGVLSTVSETRSLAEPFAFSTTTNKQRADLSLNALPPTALTTLATATTTSLSTTITLFQTPSPTPPTTTTTSTAFYYPPAYTTYKLPIRTIIGIVVSGVAFLVLLAILAAVTVWCFDRKKESKAEKEERKRQEKMEAKNTALEEEDEGEGEGEGESEDSAGRERYNGHGNSAGVINAADLSAGTPASVAVADGPSVIGTRYASMIGVKATTAAAAAAVHTHTQTTTSASSAWKGKGKASAKSIVHLPVHVLDLGTPRSSQVHYEREDPGDEERDERGMKRGASWWHPEL